MANLGNRGAVLLVRQGVMGVFTYKNRITVINTVDLVSSRMHSNRRTYFNKATVSLKALAVRCHLTRLSP